MGARGPLLFTIALTVAFTIVASTSPVAAGVAGPNGTLIEETVFAYVIEGVITPATVTAWGAVTLDGTPVGDQPGDGEHLEAFAARIGASSCTSSFAGSNLVSALTGTTFAEETAIDVVMSADAEIIGDPNGDPLSWTVVTGTVTVTTTETTIETRHLTEITDETFDVACAAEPRTPAPPVDPYRSNDGADVTRLPSTGVRGTRSDGSLFPGVLLLGGLIAGLMGLRRGECGRGSLHIHRVRSVARANTRHEGPGGRITPVTRSLRGH